MGKPGLLISISHNVFPERIETGAGVLLLLAARLTLKIKATKMAHKGRRFPLEIKKK